LHGRGVNGGVWRHVYSEIGTGLGVDGRGGVGGGYRLWGAVVAGQQAE
jgi:hypothetical protein